MAIVKSPNKQYMGVSASVPFTNGVGETDDPSLLQWFESRGYQIERELEKEQDETPLEKMTLPQLKDYAAKNVIELGEVTKKEDILRVILDSQKPPVHSGSE